MNSRDAAVASGQSTSMGPEDGQLLQKQILEQLRKVTDRLDQVEHRVAATATSSTPKQELSTDSFLETIKCHKKSKKQYKSSSSSSSSDDSDDPSLETLKSHRLQQKVDARIRELNHSSHLPGKNKKLKYKSQRGGSVDVQVKHKVHWPHEAVLGGVSRQRVTYDQLSLTQWVQGFCRNILEERSGSRKDTMISYLADLRMRQISRGKGPKHPMQSYYARWREVLSSGKMAIGLTGSGGLMPKNISPPANHLGQKVNVNHGFAKASRATPVPIRKTMR